MIEPVQQAGFTVGIWYCTKVAAETDQVYNLVFGKTGKAVDLLYSDDPVKAMRARDAI